MRERKFKRQSELPTLYCCPFIKEPPHLADGKYFTPGLIEHVICFNLLTTVPIFMKKYVWIKGFCECIFIKFMTPCVTWNFLRYSSYILVLIYKKSRRILWQNCQESTN